MYLAQAFTGSTLVTRILPTPHRSSIISSKSERLMASICPMPQSSRISRSIRRRALNSRSNPRSTWCCALNSFKKRGTRTKRTVRPCRHAALAIAPARYRRALEQLWDGRCAVTGIGLRELLRASHAKPWAECKTGAERICPYNGFLLAVNLDALFDKFLISFEDDGKIIISPGLPQQDLEAAGITADMKLRFVQPKHLPFLRWHRARMAAVQRTLWRKR